MTKYAISQINWFNPLGLDYTLSYADEEVIKFIAQTRVVIFTVKVIATDEIHSVEVQSGKIYEPESIDNYHELKATLDDIHKWLCDKYRITYIDRNHPLHRMRNI